MNTHDLAAADNFILRQRDFDDPAATDEFKRFEASGVILRVARGSYVLVPEALRRPDPSWRPTLESIALGLAAASFGPAEVALIGPSAARVHGALPRSISIATVSYPSTRPRDIETVCGTVRTYRRSIDQMDVVQANSDLVQGQVTSIEMTMLDLASKAPKWPIGHSDRIQAIRLLAARADWDLAEEIANDHRKKTSLASARSMIQREEAQL